MIKAYPKNIVASICDTASPAPGDWILNAPKEGTTQAFEAGLREPLDYILLQNTIRLMDSRGNIVNGSMLITDEDKKYSFAPAKPGPVVCISCKSRQGSKTLPAIISTGRLTAT